MMRNHIPDGRRLYSNCAATVLLAAELNLQLPTNMNLLVEGKYAAINFTVNVVLAGKYQVSIDSSPHLSMVEIS